MSFNIDVIPADSRSKASIAAHVELYSRTQDTVRVHNPTDEDFIVYNDRRMTNERYSIPNKTKDIGYGPGNNDVPRFIAMRFVDKLGMEMINQKIQEDWNKKKGKFRLEEQGQMEERLALRSSDPKLWEEVTKQLWLGVVKRYQSDTLLDDVEDRPERKEYGSSAEETLDRLGMVDAEIGVDQRQVDSQEDMKNKFLEQIS